jgi:C4-dicarboxylate transporter, DctM subunit
MEWYEAAIGLMSLLIFLLILGMPIPFAMAAASLPFLWQIQDFWVSLVSVELNLWGVWVNYVFLAAPLFVYTGEVIGRSNIGGNLFEFLHRAVRVRGSAAYGSIAASAGFGAVCGSSMVGAITIGGVALPEMIRLGYDRKLASGVLAAGGTLSVLIPPSLILLYYGIVADQSIGDLFIAGVIPGLILIILFSVVVSGWSKFFPAHLPSGEKMGAVSFWSVLIALGPIVLIGITISVSIYGGIATPTEAGAIAALLTTALGFSIGGLTAGKWLQALYATIRTMGYLGILLSAGVLFGFVLTYYRVPQEFSSLFISLDMTSGQLLFLVIVFYFLLGMFLEPVSMIVITIPPLVPVLVAADINLVWFGVIFTILMEIAVLTPPMGLNLYVIQGIGRGVVKLSDVIIGCIPFILALFFLVAILISFPQVALWLPGSK